VPIATSVSTAKYRLRRFMFALFPRNFGRG